MKMKKIKRLIALSLLITLTYEFTGCDKPVKEIVVSNDVKKDVAVEEKNSIKVEKISDLDGSMYNPLYWKDDENFVAFNIDMSFPSKKYNIYNVNINTSEVTRIGSLNDIEILNCSYVNDSELQGARILFIRDFKLWVYDTSNNTTKFVYDLAEVKKEIEEYLSKYTVEKKYDESGKLLGIDCKLPKEDSERFMLQEASDFPMWLRGGFVLGSNKYICINCPGGLRILDLDTSKAVKLSPIPPYRMEQIQNDLKYNEITDDPILHYKMEEIQDNIMYSKAADTFYICTRNDTGAQTDEILYGFKINEPDNLKEIVKMPRINLKNTSMSNDGKNFYFFTYKRDKPEDSRESNSIVMYNTELNTFTKLFEDKSDLPYNFYDYNYKNGLMYYGCGNLSAYRDNAMTFLGSMNGGKLKVVQNVTTEKIENEYALDNSIMYNKNQDKFIQEVTYLDKDFKLLKRKFCVYALKNK